MYVEELSLRFRASLRNILVLIVISLVAIVVVSSPVMSLINTEAEQVSFVDRFNLVERDILALNSKGFQLIYKIGNEGETEAVWFEYLRQYEGLKFRMLDLLEYIRGYKQDDLVNINRYEEQIASILTFLDANLTSLERFKEELISKSNNFLGFDKQSPTQINVYLEEYNNTNSRIYIGLDMLDDDLIRHFSEAKSDIVTEIVFYLLVSVAISVSLLVYFYLQTGLFYKYVVIPLEEISKGNDGCIEKNLKLQKGFARFKEIKRLADRLQNLYNENSNHIRRLESYYRRERLINEELFESYKAKDDVLKTLSHDLKTPLTSFNLGLNNLSEYITQEDGNDLLVTMKSISSYISLFVDNLNFIDINGFDAMNGFEHVELSEVIEEIKLILQPLLDYHDIRMEIIFSRSKIQGIVVVRFVITQVLINILSNSIRHSKSSVVRVKIERTIEDKLKLTICDYGTGFDVTKILNGKDKLERCRWSSNGSGLILTKNLCDRFGVDFNLFSSIGKGTKVVLTINSSAELENNQFSKYSTKFDRSNGLVEYKYKILVAEDFELTGMLSAIVGSKSGFDVNLVANGIEALDSVKHADFDMVLLDINMPLLDGFETSKQIKSIKKNSLVVGISAEVDKETEKRGALSGMESVLIKPIDFQILAKMIEEYQT